MRPAPRRVATLTALAAVVLAATGCGDDDDAAPTSAAGDGQVTAASTVAATAVPATTTRVTTPSTGSSPATSAAAIDPTTVAPPPAPATAAPTTAPGSPPEPAVSFTEIANLDAPVDLSWRAGDDALYAVEQPGRVTRLADGAATTVLDVTDLTDADRERGLLGLAFDPTGTLAYVDYTDLDGWTVITEHPVGADGTFGTGDDSRLLLEIEQPYSNHNGGDLAFGPDGMLYVGMGDGGSSGDPERRATDLGSLLGKLLRVDPAPSGGQPYTVPADNPFVGTEGARPEIWSSGLRNPWRFSFDRATGDLWIADVGQNAVEEINAAPAADGTGAGRGLSFGWSAFEGDRRFNDDVSADGHVPPFATYTHDEGCSVSGGLRVRGGPVAELDGWYVYADYCSGQVWALEVTGEGSALAPGRRVTLGQVPSPTAVVDGPAGEVYVTSQAGPVLRLDPP